MIKKIFLFLLILPLSFAFAAKDFEGTAKGELQVSGKKVELLYSYAVQKTKKLSVILADRPVPMEALGDYKALVNLSNEDKLKAVEVVIDPAKKAAAEVFFFDNRLPAELSVKDPGPFTAKKLNDKTVSGKLVMNDPDFSFGYDATFSAPVYKPAITPGRAVATNMTTEEQGKLGLKNAGLSFNEETFVRVIQDGNAGAVQLFLAAGMPPMARGKQAIWLAIEFKHPEVVKTLIEAGADVNEPGDYGQSMVMLAADHKNIEILEMLIAAGADVNRPNEYKIAPLASAAEQGNMEIIETLLKAGAKVNARNTYGGTALQVAVLRGYTDIVKRLIEAGADVKRDRAELLEIARREKHAEIEKILLSAK
jgi:hypothetical protein